MNIIRKTKNYVAVRYGKLIFLDLFNNNFGDGSEHNFTAAVDERTKRACFSEECDVVTPSFSNISQRILAQWICVAHRNFHALKNNVTIEKKKT